MKGELFIEVKVIDMDYVTMSVTLDAYQATIVSFMHPNEPCCIKTGGTLIISPNDPNKYTAIPIDIYKVNNRYYVRAKHVNHS